MRRALQLAANGWGMTSPNPMVGAVIVCGGEIIGEGWHRCFGGPHAEVNAVNSVKDKSLLHRSAMYVTLEPCSHYGKTPPCADLLLSVGIPCVVIGSLDPNEKVSGMGMRMLREHGVEIVSGVLEKECRALNAKFMVAHTLRRPYVLLKWACSSDGFLDRCRDASAGAQMFSTRHSLQVVHRLRSEYDAVMVGAKTVIMDNPRLNVRIFPGRSPKKVVIDRHGRIPSSSRIFEDGETLYYTSVHRTDINNAEIREISANADIDVVLSDLFSLGITSLMVEGGATLLGSFVESGMWDEARVEISPLALGRDGRSYVQLPDGSFSVSKIDGNTIINIKRRIADNG